MSKIFEEYMTFIEQSAYYAGAGDRSQEEYVYLLAGLSGESGEVADDYKKIQRHIGLDEEVFQAALTPEVRMRMINELGDTLYYLSRMCEFFGITVEQLAIINVHKLFKRHTYGAKSDKPDAVQFTQDELKWPFEDIPFSPDATDLAIGSSK